jgi:hypothetical protein
MKILIFLLMILIVVLRFEARSQTNLPPATSIVSNVPESAVRVVPPVSGTSVPFDEKTALQRELTMTDTYDSNLLKTVHWTLSTVFTSVILLVG